MWHAPAQWRGRWAANGLNGLGQLQAKEDRAGGEELVTEV